MWTACRSKNNAFRSEYLIENHLIMINGTECIGVSWREVLVSKWRHKRHQHAIQCKFLAVTEHNKHEVQGCRPMRRKKKSWSRRQSAVRTILVWTGIKFVRNSKICSTWWREESKNGDESQTWTSKCSFREWRENNCWVSQVLLWPRRSAISQPLIWGVTNFCSIFTWASHLSTLHTEQNRRQVCTLFENDGKTKLSSSIKRNKKVRE